MKRLSIAMSLLALMMAACPQKKTQTTGAGAKSPAASPAAGPTTLATAAKWVDIAAEAHLTVDPPGPIQEITDPADPTLSAGGASFAALLPGLDFKGVAIQRYRRLEVDPAVNDETLVRTNYGVRAFVFGTEADAQKFREADSNEVLGRGALKQVDTFGDGVVLQDAHQHVNAMFTLGNVAIDIRTGGRADTPLDVAVKDVKRVAEIITANSKKS